jgi:hypothetical protein
VPVNREISISGILLSGDYSGICDRGDIEVDPYKEAESGFQFVAVGDFRISLGIEKFTFLPQFKLIDKLFSGDSEFDNMIRS